MGWHPWQQEPARQRSATSAMHAGAVLDLAAHPALVDPVTQTHQRHRLVRYS